jgi:hypothetical protein
MEDEIREVAIGSFQLLAVTEVLRLVATTEILKLLNNDEAFGIFLNLWHGRIQIY